MEVVMGRCFPLPGPGLQHGSDYPVVKGVIYKGDKTPDSPVAKHVNGKENYSTGEAPRPSDQGRGPGKVLSPHQNGITHTSKQPVTVMRNHRPSSQEREPCPPKAEEIREKKGQTNEKPKMQSILRRTCSESDPEGRDSAESSNDGKDKQDCGNERELSWGRRAWEITQRRKAQMREEFFKVPYEECNREAARSLGGRLNKSEPRLHTLGKERKKRNSLSYKRRVHFDLDYDEDEDDRKPRWRTKSFETPDPPKKVVVSIYSIDKPKSIQPDALVYCSGPGGSPQATRDTANIRTRSARPTDLDSLQQQVQTDVAERQQRSDSTEQPDSKADKQVLRELTQRTTPTPTPKQPSNGRATTPVTDTAMARSDKLITPTPEDPLTPPIRPPREPTVRQRHTPLSPLQSTPSNRATPSPPHLASNTSYSSPEPPSPAPVPAPRSHLTNSHSLPGYNRPSSTSHSQETPQMSSLTSLPRPDHLNLNAASSRAAVHVFTPTKTFVHPQEGSPRRAHITTFRSQTSPSTHVPVTPTAATTRTYTTFTTPITTPCTSSTPSTPDSRFSVSPSTQHTPTTPQSATHFPNGPVPMPRKRISVSQQTPTPQTSPSHRSPASAPHTPTTVLTQISTPNTTHNARNSHTPAYKTANPHKSFTTTNSTKFTNSTAYPQKHTKENDATRQKKKMNATDRENSVNILMTKGESYAKHNIIISSHTSAAPPSVTVRKVFIPVTTPSRSSPSPTPSCASSSCSFGSSGSSSGCYSGSPSPTPTPSPTRIRASCVPTDL